MSGAGDGEHVGADNRPPESAGLQSVIDGSVIDWERQQPGADLGGAGDGEHGGADNRPAGRAGLHSVIDSERQPPGADLGGAWDGEHGGADNRPPGRAGLQSVIDSAASMIQPKRPFFAEKGEPFTRSEFEE